MNTATMPMPGALRLRALHPLTDGDGSCSLIYDLERAAVLEVPPELQFHVASALETGEPDEDLLSWLVREDLITSEGWAGGSTEMEVAGALEAAGWWNLSSIYRLEDEVHARIDQLSEEDALQAIDLVFRQSFGASRVRFHLGWDGPFPGSGLIERIVVEAGRRASLAHQEVSYELTLDASAVTPAVVAFLSDYPFQVVLRCGTFPRPGDPAALAEEVESWVPQEAVALLLASLADRVTVRGVLTEGARLFHLWNWAKRAGVRHLDAVCVEGEDGEAPRAGWRDFRNDLQAVCDEMGSDLEAQRIPIDYQPLTRIVRRLMRSEPLEGLESEGHGGSPVADVYPLAALESMDSRFMPNAWMGVGDVDDPSSGFSAEAEEEEAAGGFPCHGCWARYICSHSALLASSLEGGGDREPAPESCSLWRLEAEAALRLYHRMAHADPLLVLGLFEEPSRVPVDPLSRRENLWNEPTF